MRTAVAKKPEAGGGGGGGGGSGVKPDFTTLRVYGEDGADICDLSSLLNETAADVYRQHLAPIIKKLLREKLQERLKRVQG